MGKILQPIRTARANKLAGDEQIVKGVIIAFEHDKRIKGHWQLPGILNFINTGYF